MPTFFRVPESEQLGSLGSKVLVEWSHAKALHGWFGVGEV